MRINNAISEIIHNALAVDAKRPGDTRVQAVAEDILSSSSNTESMWRKPVVSGFWQWVLRPICNLISKEWCKYLDFKVNLSSILDDLDKSSPVSIELSDLKEQAKLKSIPEEAKGMLDVYTKTLERVVQESRFNREQTAKLLSLITQITDVVKKTTFEISLPETLQSYYKEASELQRLLKQDTVGVLEQISNRLASLQKTVQNLPDYKESLLEQEVVFASLMLQAKRQAQVAGTTVEQMLSGVDSARLALVQCEDFKKIPAQKQDEVVALFDEQVKPVLIEQCKEALKDLEKRSIQDIRTLGKDDAKALEALRNRVCEDVAKEASNLQKSTVGSLIYSDVLKEFEKISESIGNALLHSQPALEVYEGGQMELKELRAKVASGHMSAEELQAHREAINAQLILLKAANQTASQLADHYSTVQVVARPVFFQQYEGQLAEKNREYMRLLEDVGKAINAKLGPISPQEQESIADTANKVRLYLAGQSAAVTDLTRASEASGWKPWMANTLKSAVGWTTGTRDMFATSSVTHSTAINAIGAASTFAVYSSLGWLVGNLGPYASVAYGAGAVGASLLVPTIKKAYQSKSSRTVQALSGPLIMAGYALIAPVAGYLLAERVSSFRDAQNAVTADIKKLKSTVDETAADVQQFNATVSELDQHVGSLNNKIMPDLKQHVHEFESTVAQTGQDVVIVTDKTIALQGQTQQVAQTAARLQEGAQSLKHLATEAQDQLAVCTPQNCGEVAQSVAGQVGQQVLHIEQQADALNGQVVQLAKVNGELAEKLAIVHVDAEHLKANLQDLMQDNVHLQGNATLLEKCLIKAEGQVQTLKTDVVHLEADNAKLAMSVDALDKRLHPTREVGQKIFDGVIGGLVTAAGVGIGFIPGFQVPGALIATAGVGHIVGFSVKPG